MIMTLYYRYYDTLNVKVNGLKSVTTFMDENAYVDMWVAWTDSKTFSMGLGLEAGVNEHFNWADPDSEVEYNDIVSLGIGTWATEKLRITFYPGELICFIHNLPKLRLTWIP